MECSYDSLTHRASRKSNGPVPLLLRYCRRPPPAGAEEAAEADAEKGVHKEGSGVRRIATSEPSSLLSIRVGGYCPDRTSMLRCTDDAPTSLRMIWASRAAASSVRLLARGADRCSPGLRGVFWSRCPNSA